MAKPTGTDSDLHFIDTNNVTCNLINSKQVQQLQDAMKSAAETTLMTTERKQPGWFEAGKSQIEPVIIARNPAQTMYNEINAQEINARLKTARKKVKRAVTAATRLWTAQQV